jgi:hypothetical protein
MNKETPLETPVLSIKSEFPTEKIIFSHIGKSKPLWLSLFQYIAEEHPDFTQEWRYYNDGKSWLMKVQYKKKTVFWLSVIKNSFRTTFYIHEKVKKTISDSKLSDELKEQFLKGKNFGTMRIRGITVVYKNKKNVENAKLLIDLKISIK